MPSETVYLDHAATSPLREDVLREMMPFLKESFGNPSSVHGPGRTARHAVERSRERVAAVLGVEPGDILFTSGGSEANNTVLRGGCPPDRPGLVTDVTEHESVLETARRLEKGGIDLRFLPVDDRGRIQFGTMDDMLKEGIGLVSVVHVNNEIGTVNHLEGMSTAARKAGARIHTDAVQSIGWTDLTTLASIVDFLTLSGHKAGGPKGVGVLMAREDMVLEPWLFGGPQERERRAGTENVAAIVGMAAAIEMAQQQRSERRERFEVWRRQLASGLVDAFGTAVRINTPMDPEASSAHILNVLFLDREGTGLDGEMLILGLDLAGVHVSAGSACSSGTVAPSHVLTGIGISKDQASGSVRFSMGWTTTSRDIDIALDRTISVVRRMRS